MGTTEEPNLVDWATPGFLASPLETTIVRPSKTYQSHSNKSLFNVYIHIHSMCSIPLESPNTYSYLVSFTVTSPGFPWRVQQLEEHQRPKTKTPKQMSPSIRGGVSVRFSCRYQFLGHPHKVINRDLRKCLKFRLCPPQCKEAKDLPIDQGLPEKKDMEN